MRIVLFDICGYSQWTTSLTNMYACFALNECFWTIHNRERKDNYSLIDVVYDVLTSLFGATWHSFIFIKCSKQIRNETAKNALVYKYLYVFSFLKNFHILKRNWNPRLFFIFPILEIKWKQYVFILISLTWLSRLCKCYPCNDSRTLNYENGNVMNKYNIWRSFPHLSTQKLQKQDQVNTTKSVITLITVWIVYYWSVVL